MKTFKNTPIEIPVQGQKYASMIDILVVALEIKPQEKGFSTKTLRTIFKILDKIEEIYPVDSKERVSGEINFEDLEAEFIISHIEMISNLELWPFRERVLIQFEDQIFEQLK